MLRLPHIPPLPRPIPLLTPTRAADGRSAGSPFINVCRCLVSPSLLLLVNRTFPTCPPSPSDVRSCAHVDAYCRIRSVCSRPTDRFTYLVLYNAPSSFPPFQTVVRPLFQCVVSPSPLPKCPSPRDDMWPLTPLSSLSFPPKAQKVLNFSTNQCPLSPPLLPPATLRPSFSPPPLPTLQLPMRIPRLLPRTLPALWRTLLGLSLPPPRPRTPLLWRRRARTRRASSLPASSAAL